MALRVVLVTTRELVDSAQPPMGIAAASRARTTSRSAGVLAGSTLLVLPLVGWLGAGTVLVGAWGICGAGYLVAQLLVRRGSSTTAAWLTFALQLTQSVEAGLISAKHGAVATSAQSYWLALPLLIGAITLPPEWGSISWMLLAALATPFIAGALGEFRPFAHPDQVLGLAFALLVFALSIGWQRTRVPNPSANAASVPSTLAQADPGDDERAAPELPLTDSADDLCALVDAHTVPIYLNPAHGRVFGQPLEELRQGPLLRLVAPDSHDDYERAIADALERGRGSAEVKLCVSDESTRTFDMKVNRVEGEPEPRLAVISRDVTERRRLQQRLIATERTESLARLAGSIAHDFNNLLMVIGGAGEMARHAIKHNPEALEDLDSVLEATRNAAKLTRQLLMFSRKQVVTVTELDLAHSLYSVRDLLERLVGNKVSLVFDFQSCPKVMIAAAHLEQLAMDLAMNARDAMPQGGTLTFALRPLELPSGTSSLAPGTYVELEVSDEGTGIPEDAQPHIFEPLFTTKGEAGTGLGLPTCQSIVLESRGSISVESSPGKGTTFHIRLPSSALSSVRPLQRPSPFPTAIRRVLVVDDEPAPRETAARMLRAAGFEVVVATSLDEARRLIDDPTLELDALLTDVVLRGELGTDLLEDCRKRRPKSRIVVMSGYSPNPQASQKVLAVSAKFLPKPFNSEELLRALGGAPKPGPLQRPR